MVVKGGFADGNADHPEQPIRELRPRNAPQRPWNKHLQLVLGGRRVDSWHPPQRAAPSE
jgi:hypothetical protein